jgi:hypothetical protein
MRHLTALLILTATTAHATPPVCLQSYRIDHTEIPNDSTILFHMRDHTTYRAHLINGCVGLQNDTSGFTYEPIPGSDEICANLLTIRLNTTHQVCLVGAIEKVAPKH